MKESNQKWHNITLQCHNSIMFDTLIYPHNIISDLPKEWQLEDENGLELPTADKGYFAMKDVEGKKTKYFIPVEIYDMLPIRIDEAKELRFKESTRSKSIILYPTKVKPFRVRPEQMWNNNHDFIEELAPFEHSEQLQWKLSKIVAVMGYVGKTFCGICSPSEFGKSSIYLILDAITKRCPVFQPRSVPGVLAQITGEGNMVFDETHDAPADVLNTMENFSLQVAGNSPVYINGAMKSAHTKAKYDVSQQSVTYLYNIYSNYREPEKQFFDYVWKNQKAMNSRFLKLKFDGTLKELFDKDFDIPSVAENNKMFYMKIAKHLLYLKELKTRNAYNRRFSGQSLTLTGRHEIIYNELTWGIDLFSDTQEQYIEMVKVLNKCIIDYMSMLGKPVEITVNNKEQPKVEEETIEDSQKSLIAVIKEKKHVKIDELEKMFPDKDIDSELNVLKKNGDIFENKRDEVHILE